MIVIATNNGRGHLKNLLDSLKNVDLEDELIKIVDTISTEKEHFNFLKKIHILYPNMKIEVIHTPYRGFDTGAYIYTYQNFKDSHYIFLHDSIKIINKNFIKEIKKNLKKYDVISFCTFDFMGDGDDEWKSFLKKNTNEETYEKGIFGPMFACSLDALNSININELFIPKNKNQQSCYEGIWYILFQKNNLKILSYENVKQKFKSNYIHKNLVNRQ